MQDRISAYKDCSQPYPRAGLWYVTHKGGLYEAWALSPDADNKGPTQFMQANFKWQCIGWTRKGYRINK